MESDRTRKIDKTPSSVYIYIGLESGSVDSTAVYERTKTDRIDLSTFEGLATLKHWVEHEVLEDLRKNYSDNPLVQHLVRVPENQRDILATDIDLLNPNTTTVTT